MERLKQLLSFLLVLLFLSCSSALKFDIPAHPGHESSKSERCIRNFVAKDQLVVVTAIVDGQRGDGQTLNMHVSFACSRDTIRIAAPGLTLGLYRLRTQSETSTASREM